MAFPCACCDYGNTFRVNPEAGDSIFSQAQRAKFRGEIGVNVYGAAGGAEFQNCEATVSGNFDARTMILDLAVKSVSIGRLVATPVGEVEKSMVGLDIALPKSSFQKFKLDENEPPVYHRWRVKVELEADETILKHCSVTFKKEAWLTFHGLSNDCWDPFDNAEARWTLEYNVIAEGRIENAFGTGVMH